MSAKSDVTIRAIVSTIEVRKWEGRKKLGRVMFAPYAWGVAQCETVFPHFGICLPPGGNSLPKWRLITAKGEGK